MREKARKKPGSLFFQILITLCFLLVLTVITLSITISISYERKTLGILKDFSRQILTQISYSSNYLDTSARMFATSLFSDNLVIPLMHSRNLELWEIVKTLDAVNMRLQSTSFIHSVYVFNKGIDCFYTTTTRGIQNRSEFFDREIALLADGSRHVPKLEPIPRRISASTQPDSKELLNVYTYIIYQRWSVDRHLPSAVIVNILAQYLMEMIDSLSVQERTTAGDIFIVDSEGRIVGHSKDDMFLQDFSERKHIRKVIKSPGTSGSFISRIDGAKSVVTYVSSEQTGWSFVKISPYKVTIQPILTQRLLILLIGLFFLFAGIILAFIFSSRLYLPIGILVRQVKRIASTRALEQTKDEMLFLSQVFTQTVDRVNFLRKFKENNLRIIKEDFLQSLLNGKQLDRSELVGKIEEFELRIRSDGRFQVILFKIDRSAGRSTGYEEKYRLVYNFAIQRTIHAVAGAYFDCETMDMDADNFAVLLSFERNDGSDKGNEKILHMAIAEVQKQLWNSFAVSVSAAISGVSEDIADINFLYSEVLDLISYRLIHGLRCIITSEQLERIESDAFDFPIEKETSLLNALRNGEIDKARQSYTDIVGIISAYPYENIMLSLTRLSSSIFDLLNTIESNSIIKFPVRFSSFIKDLNRCETIKQINRNFLTLFDKAIDTQKSLLSDKSGRNIQTVKEIINTHYMDINLCTGSIADLMKMSPVYLGKIFRECCHWSISEYIVSVRLKKAKELLVESSCTVKEISRQVGIDSPRYFFTKFKDRYGITPTQFREKTVAGHSVKASY